MGGAFSEVTLYVDLRHHVLDPNSTVLVGWRKSSLDGTRSADTRPKPFRSDARSQGTAFRTNERLRCRFLESESLARSDNSWGSFV
jgi:hypothetical protein